jgi:hypothetical protein
MSEDWKHKIGIVHFSKEDCEKPLKVLASEYAERWGKETDAACDKFFDEWEKELMSDGWIECSERMPEGYGEYLVYWVEVHKYWEDVGPFLSEKRTQELVTDYCKTVQLREFSEGKFSGTHMNAYATHWQPLPAPPTDEGKE